MKKSKELLVGLLCMIMVLCSFAGCASNGGNETADDNGAVNQEVNAEEEYVWISCLSNQSMFVNSDQVGLKKFGEEYGVTVTVVGPTDYDIQGQAAAIDDVVARKPAGIMVIGMESALKGSIDKAIEAGIPVVTIDADVSDSQRLCFIGTDWYQVGVEHAKAVAEQIGGKGKTAIIMQKGTETQEDALRGYKETMAEYPEIELIDAYSAEGSIETATQITTDVITANPDIAAISCFDGSTPGVGVAIKEMDKAGEIVATGQNAEPTQLQQLKDGYLTSIIGQKRELFAYYGGVVLYHYNHTTVSLTEDDQAADISPVPSNIDTGLYLITADNVDNFLSE